MKGWRFGFRMRRGLPEASVPAMVVVLIIALVAVIVFVIYVVRNAP